MTIQNLINAEFDFAQLGANIKEWYDGLMATESIVSIFDTVDSAISSVLPAAAIAGILLAFSLIIALFGKRLLGFQKFIGALIVGFVCGAALVTPLVAEFVTLEPWIVGLVVGVVAALLSALVYFVGYIVVPGYAVYLVLMGGYYLPTAITDLTKGQWIISLVAAVVVVVILLLLRKWVEMLGTAFLGGWSAYVTLDALLYYTTESHFADMSAIAEYVDIIKIAIIALITLIGFIVQVKTRRRY